MKTILLPILILFILSCGRKNETGLREDLYQALLDYQKNNPIPPIPPKPDQKSKIPPRHHPDYEKYIYEVLFLKDKSDTLVQISLAVKAFYQYKHNDPFMYGVYMDKQLKRTYILDKENLSKEIVKKYLKNGLKNFDYVVDYINDTMYIKYVYSIKNGKLRFKEKLRGNIGK
ncbi:MAG: hypothetical protein ACRCVT_01685 [Leadbetterella sp.]